MENNHILGKIGEKIAVKYLQKQNYEIITTNFYTRKGEIDIIAKQDKEIIFIEVKTRNNLSTDELFLVFYKINV
mgnify:CR=1 FL=1